MRVVTKGGLIRPDGAWVPDGRARALIDAARASRERLGAIDVYLLHAIDPRTSLATSVRALAKLRDAGIVRAIGVANEWGYRQSWSDEYANPMSRPNASSSR